MANLRANKITSTEVFETTGSVQFDGTGDYLSLASSGDFNFGTGDFTLECWIYALNLSGVDKCIVEFRGSSVSTDGWVWFINSNNVMQIYDNSPYSASSGIISISQWNHLSICRKNGVLTYYLNGISSGSVNYSSSTNASSTGIRIATRQDTTNSFNGHISNLRVLKGTALYTKNFTPPSRELTVIPNTVLLACTSTTNTAQEATGKTITVNGNAVANELTPGLLTDVVKSGGTSAITGSVEFDGTGDYLTLASSGDFAFGIGDFTVEMWVYHTDLTGQQTYFGDTWGSTAGIYTYKTSNNEISLYDTAQRSLSAFNVISANTWYHIAWTRQSGILRAFLNGSLVDSDTYTGNFTTTQYYVGDTAGTSSGGMIGFISNLRVLKGQALYTGSFIPPSRELKKIPNTVLLCCKNSSDPTAEETGKTITANGDPAASNFTPQIGSDGSVTFDGVTKINTPNYFYLPTGNTENRGRGRGVFTISAGTPANSNAINYLQISSSGNSIDFGDLTSVSGSAGSVSSSTRMIIALGNNSPVTASPGNVNTLDYLTIATTSNTLDFGDLTTKRGEIPGVSNSTRGVFIGGINELVSPYSGPTITYTNTMDYISIASLGNALDFGDSHSDKSSHNSAVGNNTRGVYTVSWNGSTTVNNINYITISTTGNGQDFGDLITPQNRQQKGSVSNSTRGLFAGGISPVSVNTIEYITITSLGTAQDFGDLSYARRNAGGTSNSIRGVFAGGYDAPPGPLGRTNVIDYVILASTGNASDFGDLLEKSLNNTGASDSHGGLS